MSHSYEYERPALTVDVVVFRMVGSVREVLLIKRGKEPFRGCWAFPGGHVNPGEDLPMAAARELAEETCLPLIPDSLQLVGVYGKPGRDPRGWYVDVAYTAHVSKNLEVRAGDDAAEAQWFPVHDMLVHPGKYNLAFDHWDVLKAALEVDDEGEC